MSSERGYDDDPLVLWLNGGPGCSSFDGFVYEHGPFSFSAAPGGGVRLARNPFAWSSVANVVYLDSPAGVGLSYSDTLADYATNDTATARDADAFLRALVVRYPWLAQRDLYIAGESYAGVYVPNLARAVLAGNAAGAQPALQLVGYAVGNGCTDAAFDGSACLPQCIFALADCAFPQTRLCRLRWGRASSPRIWQPRLLRHAAAAQGIGTRRLAARAGARWTRWTRCCAA